MKKSLFLLMMCAGLGVMAAHAQDDDVYFVPSSKSKMQRETVAGTPRSSYTPITTAEETEDSNWAEGRGNGNWDVDDYNRRGKHYKGGDAEQRDTTYSYDEGYADGYEDGSYTARIVRFWSPRPGVYVSSPYYLDYYDLCYYDPFYYGYGSWWGWGGWHGWWSWYGWRPYYGSWHWGRGGWYDPWWGPGYVWHPHHWGGNWWPSNAERGPRGGYVAYGGRRGTGNATFGRSANNRRGMAGTSTFGSRTTRSNYGTTGTGRNSGNTRTFGNPSTNRRNNTFNTPGRDGIGTRTQNGVNKRESNRSFRNSSTEQPSRRQSTQRSTTNYNSNTQRSNSGSIGGSGRSSFGTGGRSGGSFGSGGSRGGFGGGGRSTGGRR